MKQWRWGMLAAGATLLMSVSMGFPAPDEDSLKPRVPPDQLDEAKKLSTSLFDDAKHVPTEIINEGKVLYEGKGSCFNCHGKSGKGDGPIGGVLTPKPRDLTHCEFQDTRSDGELYWVLKHGVQGTGMMSLIPSAVSEEEGWKIIAYVRSFCDT
jgi:mono/diheme cytochrome c family protein